MKAKAILKALFVSYGLTGAGLLLLALLVYRLNLGVGPASAGITAIYVASCLAGGFAAGRVMQKNKYFWGILSGLCYFLLLAAVSVCVQQKWDMTWMHLITALCMCVGGGALGGMLA